ncbi:MAG: T9SS-dependent M36 family metallopeptidase [Bacteroidota bacterium]
MNKYYPVFLCIIFSFLNVTLFAQSSIDIIAAYLEGNQKSINYSDTDMLDWRVYDSHTSKQSGAEHVYIQQYFNNVEIYNGVANFALKDGKVAHFGNSLETDISKRINRAKPAISAESAIRKAVQQLSLSSNEQLIQKEQQSPYISIFEGGDISTQDIKVELVYQPVQEGQLTLAWHMVIYELSDEHWWSMRVDAVTGQIIDKNNLILSCNFGPAESKGHVCSTSHKHHRATEEVDFFKNNSEAPDSYRVYALPIESPNHGSRTLEVDPADLVASPFGWHDDNGVAGPEYTTTRGNNVFAYEDRDANNVPGYAPDGGLNLDFDFPLDFNQQPVGYEDAAITQLFYMNNIMHDVWFQYGFDEASGNFQEINYSGQGAGSDYVNAEAQDGSGTNNANFGTPDDGFNPRMQMYLWTGGSGLTDLLTVNSPGSVAGVYQASEATFGPGVPATPITADLVLVEDGVAPDIYDACSPITNAAQIVGKIGVIRRGDCTFVEKVQAAQDAGAVAVIIVNNVAGAPINMGGNSTTITIPSIMISNDDGTLLANELNNGTTINGTIQNTNASFDRDGDFDNVIVAHEYGHGISNRLVGGPSNTGCLFTDQQMGEGWSDYFGLIMTIEPGDMASDIRGVGTFATGQPTTGGGIRPAPYSTDFSINNYTYADISNVSIPHGVGFVWCTALWDMTWDLIAQDGFDPDLYSGTGGNNIAMQLVIESLKLTPCGTDFIQGRDAILAADQLLYNGANECLIWQAFAMRGIGFSATSQGGTTVTEAFDLPPVCLTPTSAPTAEFTHIVSSFCSGDVSFSDLSTDIPQTWQWDFGDGNSSDEQNPFHTYENSGTYTVVLTASNEIGSDMYTQIVNISLPDNPVASDINICSGEAATLSGTASGTIAWYDESGDVLLGTGDYTTPVLADNTTYMASNLVELPPQFVGPVDGSFSTGGYHNTGFTGTINFTAHKPFILKSVWVDAGSPGPRPITLWDAANGGGNVVEVVTINVPAGPSTVTLDLLIPAPGEYSIGGASIDLYRNNANTSYPYSIPNVVDLTSSSATTGPLDFYYYLYNWEVQELPCESPKIEVEVTVSEADFNFAIADLTVDFTDISTNASSWSWDFGDNSPVDNTQNPDHTYAEPGTYQVTLTLNGGACTITQEVTVTSTSIENIIDGNGFTIYPNPGQTMTQVSFERAVTKDITIEIISANGQVVNEYFLRTGEQLVNMNLEKLSSAIYFVRMTSELESVSRKLVIQK